MFNHKIFEKGIGEINKINSDYIIHLGDITHDGTLQDYEIAVDLLKPLKDKKFSFIPGNHDSKNVGYLLYEEMLGSRSFEINDDPDLYILGVDSSIPDEDPGHIGIITLEKSEEKLYNNYQKVKIFCFHHQLIPIPFTGRERSAIFDAGDVLDMTLKTNVDIILNGHRHITNLYSCTDGDKDMVLFNCGTMSCNKTRYREQFSYTILDINEKMINFTIKKLMDDTEFTNARYLNPKYLEGIPSKGSMIAKIVHIGNTDFSNKSFIPTAFEKAVEKINSLNPDIIVHTGSVTEKNTEEDYTIAKEKLSKFKSPLLILPGENDLTKFDWDLYESKIKELIPYDDLLNPFFENRHICIKGINTIHPHITNGTIGRRRMRDVISKCKNNEIRKINAVAVNNRLVPIPNTKFEKILTDSGDVLKNFTDINNHIDILFTGRNNIGYTLQLENTVISACGSISSTNTIEHNKNSFNLIKCYQNGFVQVEEFNVNKTRSTVIGQFWI